MKYARLAIARVRYAEPGTLNSVAREAVPFGPEVVPSLERIALDDQAKPIAQLCAIKALALILNNGRAVSMGQIEQRWRNERPIIARACSKDMAFYRRDWDPDGLAKAMAQIAPPAV